MAKKRKKKQPKRASKHPDFKFLTNPEEIETAETAIRKVLQVYGLDPNLLDSFSKHQRWIMLQLRADPVYFKVAEGHRVSQRIVDFISETTHNFMRTNYFGDKSIGLTYFELATYGMAFSTVIYSINHTNSFPPAQMKVVRKLADFFKDERVKQELYLVGKYIHHIVMMVSKMSFRIYGFDWKLRGEENTLKSEIFLSSEEAVSIRFTHKQRERKAFRVRAGRLIEHPAKNATIDRHLVFPEESVSPDSDPELLEIYIQSHALQHAKERMDIFPAHMRNYHIMNPLIHDPRVMVNPDGSQMLECYFKEDDDDDDEKNEKEDKIMVRFGYFPFIVQDNKLIVLTLLPLFSPGTIEEYRLQERFAVQREDIKFLGMDKLSFFLTVDFEQIPVLKDLFMDIGIWNLILFARNLSQTDFPVDQNKTQMVKSFFEQKIEMEK
jgi:hypothetical protein